MRRVMTGALLLGFWGCGPAKQPERSESAGNEQVDERVADEAPGAPDLKYHMDVSFWAAIDARDALIDGDLERVHNFGNALAHQDLSYLPDRWQHWVKAMQQQAAEVEMAPDLPSAAQAISALAVTCGNCHWATDRGPHRQPLDPQGAEPGEPEGLDERMYRHQWAANELWMALITPSFKAWSRGSMALRRAPPEAPTRDGEEISPEMESRLAEVRRIGAQADEATSVEERTRLYGDLLATCADCHVQTKR